MPALYDLVEHVLGPDEKVLTLTPAYGPFELAATHHGRQLVTCGLLESDDGRYSIDFADLEMKLADPRAAAVLPLPSAQPHRSSVERRRASWHGGALLCS